MIRESIAEELKKRKISTRKCALDNDIDYYNFYNFLKGKRPFPVDNIEKVLKYLGLKIVSSK